MKKYLEAILAILTIILFSLVAGIALYFADSTEEQKVQKYIKEKYGFKIGIEQVIEKGIASHPTFVVFPEKHPDIIFKATLNPSTDTVTDDYPEALKADKAFHKLEKVIPAIEQLEFESFDEEFKVSYSGSKKRFLKLYSSTPIELASFKEEHLERFFELQQLIKESGASITHVMVEDNREPVESNSIYFAMADMKDAKTKEEA
ncbi:hypothetical protein [Ureibacillus sinduriensis]|uniref:Uncharacterized protein n=1 Tax=Ureibacillus sinduriensis BLB-1 = JCM 15800 TaxID=1384057 RepID=A0A0A3IAQ2_9BACL|nr:hypothetical protein [Ureibacillus sinduriensis]KGR79893.1 hypothetical protein CD33_00275 [Ureibacillus sinduriensis BLB-1 = JCM 15800]